MGDHFISFFLKAGLERNATSSFTVQKSLVLSWNVLATWLHAR